MLVRVEVGDEADTERAASGLPGRDHHAGEHKVPEPRGHRGHHDPGGEGDHGPGQQPQPVPVVSREAEHYPGH